MEQESLEITVLHPLFYLPRDYASATSFTPFYTSKSTKKKIDETERKITAELKKYRKTLLNIELNENYYYNVIRPSYSKIETELSHWRDKNSQLKSEGKSVTFPIAKIIIGYETILASITNLHYSFDAQKKDVSIKTKESTQKQITFAHELGIINFLIEKYPKLNPEKTRGAKQNLSKVMSLLLSTSESSCKIALIRKDESPVSAEMDDFLIKLEIKQEKLSHKTLKK